MIHHTSQKESWKLGAKGPWSLNVIEITKIVLSKNGWFRCCLWYWTKVVFVIQQKIKKRTEKKGDVCYTHPITLFFFFLVKLK